MRCGRYPVWNFFHWCMGATVGSVIASQGAIVPAAVGVDIGCVMAVAMTGLAAAARTTSPSGPT